MDPIGQVLLMRAPSGGVLDGLSPTSAFSASRLLLSNWGGSLYTTATGVSSWQDQTGNSRHMANANTSQQPVIVAAGPNSRNGLDFDGSNDQLDGVAISNLITASTGYIIASFIPNDVSTNLSNIYDNEAVFATIDGIIGAHIKAGFLQNYNWDGSPDVTATKAVVAGTAYVLEWWHTGGVLYRRLNGGPDEASAASNDTTPTTGLMRLGITRNTSPANSDITIFEFVTFNTIPTQLVRDAVSADLMTHVGAITIPPATEYGNTGGTGNRNSIITLGGTMTAGGGNHTMLINGSEANEYWWGSGQTNKTLSFDFGSGHAPVIDEFTWTQGSAVGHGSGTRFEGSNNGSTWTTFPESFTLGTSTTQIVPITNTTGYRYYRLNVPGATSSSPYIQEIKFKIKDY